MGLILVLIIKRKDTMNIKTGIIFTDVIRFEKKAMEKKCTLKSDVSATIKAAQATRAVTTGLMPHKLPETTVVL
jgi:hypothetical protein